MRNLRRGEGAHLRRGKRGKLSRVENRDAAADHGCEERRGDVAQIVGVAPVEEVVADGGTDGADAGGFPGFPCESATTPADGEVRPAAGDTLRPTLAVRPDRAGAPVRRVALCARLAGPQACCVHAQFAPAVGMAGSDAIFKDDTAFKAWATSCTLQRGLQNIAVPASAGKPTPEFHYGFKTSVVASKEVDSKNAPLYYTVTWTATTVGHAIDDGTFYDFGLKLKWDATPQTIAFPTTQICYAPGKKPLYLQWTIVDGSTKASTDDTEYGPAPTVTTIAADVTK